MRMEGTAAELERALDVLAPSFQTRVEETDQLHRRSHGYMETALTTSLQHSTP